MKDELSNMEQKIAGEYCKGYNDKQVAEALGMMVWTIKTHKKRIFQKWRINNTHEMVLLFIAKTIKACTSITDIRMHGIKLFNINHNEEQCTGQSG